MLVRGLLGLIGLVALWSAAIPFFGVPDHVLPSPYEVVERLGFLYDRGNLLMHIQVTLIEIIWGFLIGLVLGVFFAVVFARVPFLERISTPIILLLQTAPKIAIAPLLLLWLGLGAAPKIVLVAIVTFFPVMTAMLTGIKYVNKSYIDLADVLKLSNWQRFWYIEFPSAIPTLFAGATVATTLAMTAAVIGELMGANKGIGFLLATGQEDADTASVIAMVILLSAIGWSFYAILDHLRVRMEDRYS